MPKGHSYLLTDPVERNITRSDLLCASLGGYIVEINDKQEFDFVKDFVYFKNGVIYLVLGATDEQQEGTWTFVRSKQPAFIYSKNDGAGGSGNNCLEMWSGTMVDEPCYGRSTNGRSIANVLCEVPN